MSRISFFCSVLAFVMAGVVSIPAAAQLFPNELAATNNAIVLEPLGAWNLDVREGKCRLAGWFGTEEESHLLLIEQNAPLPYVTLTLAGPEVRSLRNANEIAFGLERDQPMVVRNSFATTELEGTGPAIILGGVYIGRAFNRRELRAARIDIERAAMIDKVVLNSGRKTVVFATGNMQRPSEALNACTSNLLREWGLDPQPHESYVPPRLLDRDAFENKLWARYPRAARRGREQAIFRIRAIVEIDGSASDCALDQATATESLDSPACIELLMARFEPARDANGTAIRSFVASSITYRISN